MNGSQYTTPRVRGAQRSALARVLPLALIAAGIGLASACSPDGSTPSDVDGGATDPNVGQVDGSTGGSSSSGNTTSGNTTSGTTTSGTTTSGETTTGGSTTGGEDAAPGACGTCPTGTTCGTANGLPVCRTSTGIPVFSHVFLVLMENTSWSRLEAATNTPNLKALREANAVGRDYHGVTHPSLPNYIALMSGDPQGIACDCKAAPGNACSASCNIFTENCNCTKQVAHFADQLETAQKTWMAYGEGMGAAGCNVNDDPATKYAPRHVPFLYFENVTSNEARCKAHVVDLDKLDLTANAPAFSFIAPNLIHDMHDPSITLTHAENQANGDAFIGPFVQRIVDSEAYKNGGLLVVVWDENDNSGIPVADSPIPIFVMSPYAKKGGFVSAVKADHYSLLATLEDSFGVPRLGNAGTPRAGIADTLSDYFPAQ